MSQRLRAYLRLTRPPNLLTAVSDIWAGAGIAGYFILESYAVWPLVLLSFSTVFLYAGGVVMNDVFDAELDAQERPERPIPSGIVSRKSAAFFGWALLVLGVLFSFIAGIASGILALAVVLACIVYDSRAKHHVFFGPLNMGICRGLNLLLGMSILPLASNALTWIAVVPIAYIAAVTLISRGEVHGGERRPVLATMFIYGLVIITILIVGVFLHRPVVTIFFLLLFSLFIFPALFKALKSPVPENIGRAVKAGVLGLILMNAAWVAAGSGWGWAIVTALLLPLSIWIAGRFAVT